MKRIVISLTNDISDDRRMLRTGQTLMDDGYEVVYICRKSSHSSTSNLKSAHYINCWFSASWAFYLEYNIRVLGKLLFIPTDLFLSVDSDTLLANTLAQLIRRKPLIIDMHELFTEVPELEGQRSKKWIWRRIESFGIKRSTNRYTVSHTIAKTYQTLYNRPFEVIRNVPSKTNAIPTEKRKRFTLVYLGVLNKGRGIDILLHSILSLPDVDLLILGEGDLYEQFKVQTSKMGLDTRVSFLGWVTPNEIPSLLQSAHVGINLLDPTSQSYYLSLANKYFDYIHAGIPIISMDFPEYQVLNERHETSILIKKLDANKVTRAIMKLKDDMIFYNRLQSNCNAATKDWNWDIESKRLLSIFDL